MSAELADEVDRDARVHPTLSVPEARLHGHFVDDFARADSVATTRRARTTRASPRAIDGSFARSMPEKFENVTSTPEA
jgi:hypothetical protein